MNSIVGKQQGLRGKRLLVIYGGQIAKEVNTCAEKYGIKVICFKPSKYSIFALLYYAINKIIPQLMVCLVKARRIDGILLIRGERLIRRSISWLSRSAYPSVNNGPPQPFIDFYPSVNRDIVEACLFDKIEKLMASLDIKNGSCMFQGIIDQGIPYIMDTAYRLSGGMDYRVVEEETSVGLIEAHILYALSNRFGHDFSRLREPYHQAYAILCIGLKNGTIAKIEGLDEISNKPYVFSLHQHYNIGHQVKTSGLFSQTGIRVFLTDTDRDKLKADIKEILGILRVDDAKGRSLLLDYPEF